MVGKPAGIVAATWLASRLGGARRALSWPTIVGGGTIAGIGFTVALLISSLAFEGQQLEEAKLGIFGAALLAALLACAMFRLIERLPARGARASSRGRQTSCRPRRRRRPCK